MIMADILFWALIVIGFYIAFVSYWLFTEALFPNFVERCRERYATVPVRCTLLGLVVAAPLLTGAVALAAHMGPILQIGGIGLVVLIVLLGLMGSAGLCRQIGQGLPGSNDSAQPWRKVWRGGLVLGITFILPVIGWFAVLPWTLISGFGVFLRVRFSRKRKSA
jgi:hypothetical protein